MPYDEASKELHIGDRRVADMEDAMTRVLAPLLGADIQVKITKVTRSDDAVTGLEMEAFFEDEEEPRFAIG